MNRGGFQMMEGRSPSWWSVNNMRPPDPELTLPFLPSSSSSSSPPAFLPQPHISSDMNSWQEGQGLRESWCQLLLGASVEEEDRYGLSHPDFPIKKMESCVDQPGADRVLLYPPPAHIADVIKREYSGLSGYVHRNEEIQVSKSSWSLPGSSPRSCVTTSFSANMLDFTNKSRHHLPADNLSEGNSKETAPAFKKARVQGSSSPKSTLKVRKEKLGDRITALHQLVSPFGKTDTASVLQEAIGYIRFLQGQIQVLSTPYLQGSAPGSMRQQPAQEEEEDEDEETKKKKDLRSRGLCLVPVSFTMHVNGGDNAAADLWAPAFSAGF